MNKVIVLLLLSAASSMATEASEVQTASVNTNYTSVTAVDGQVLVQTPPRQTLAGLSCTNNFWAALDKSASDYCEVLSLASDAMLDKRTMDITVSDETIVGDFGSISRQVLK